MRTLVDQVPTQATFQVVDARCLLESIQHRHSSDMRSLVLSLLCMLPQFLLNNLHGLLDVEFRIVRAAYGELQPLRET